jgi:general secretion pathway protein G
LVRPDLIRKTARRRRRSQAGFTLVEILVVITIIGLIMALVGPRVLNYLGESKAKAAKIQIESFSSALDLYYLDLGRYPNSSEGLAALTRSNNAPGWNGPYLRGGVVPNDPWGTATSIARPASGRLTTSFPSAPTVRKAAVERQRHCQRHALKPRRERVSR